MAFGIPSTSDDPYNMKNNNNNGGSPMLSNGHRHGAGVKMFASSYGGAGSPYANLSNVAQKTPTSLHYVISKVPNLLISGGSSQHYDSALINSK